MVVVDKRLSVLVERMIREIKRKLRSSDEVNGSALARERYVSISTRTDGFFFRYAIYITSISLRILELTSERSTFSDTPLSRAKRLRLIEIIQMKSDRFFSPATSLDALPAAQARYSTATNEDKLSVANAPLSPTPAFLIISTLRASSSTDQSLIGSPYPPAGG